ncbi:MAG: phosphate ABC transporter substrate-binding/OmpA family protein [Paracoccaceae bacterium]
MRFYSSSVSHRCLFGLVLSSALLPAAFATAQEVTLTSSNGETVINGTFLSFEDDTYTIRTGLGDLRVPSKGMTCTGSGCVEVVDSIYPDASFSIAGSDTIGLGLMPLLMQTYGDKLGAESVTTETEVAGQYYVEYIGESGFGDSLDSHFVNATSSSDAFRALLDGSANIGMASRRITPTEARALRADGAGSMIDPNQEHILAVDSLIVITHPDNPVNEMSVDQLADIYTGKIRNWMELGGPDMPIVVVHRAEGSGTGALFNQRILGDADAQLSKAAVRMSDNNSVAAIVNAEPSVIGFVGIAFQRGAQAVTLTNDCGIAMSPDAFSARTEEYLLQRRLYLYNRTDSLTAEATDFLNHVQSSQVDDVILKSGFVDLGIERREMPLDGNRALRLTNKDADTYERGFLDSLLQEMANYDRLSTTFRFATASSRLDERARIDLERLTAHLEAQPEGTEIRFVGFTDNEGSFEGNLNLSADRAARVMQEVQSYAGERLTGVSMGVSGYGQLSEAACNSTDDGRKINRRVEVWIKKS